MEAVYLSDIELYIGIKAEKSVVIKDDDYKHASKVMRHKLNDEIYVTEGLGKIYKTRIIQDVFNSFVCEIREEFDYKERLPNIIPVIPNLNKIDKSELVIEKLVELGFTKIAFCEFDRGGKKRVNFERMNRIALSALKQSLNSFLPEISYYSNLKEILKTNRYYYFDQNSKRKLSELKDSIIKSENSIYLLFGPEGGFSEKERNLLNTEKQIKITDNRLRTETAIISVCSFLVI